MFSLTMGYCITCISFLLHIAKNVIQRLAAILGAVLDFLDYGPLTTMTW